MKCDRCGYSDNGTGDWAHACGPVSIQRAPVANTRIQELAEQATVYHNGGLGTEIESFDKEKFAELIVRECLLELADVRLEHVFDPETDRVFGIAIDRIKTFRS